MTKVEHVLEMAPKPQLGQRAAATGVRQVNCASTALVNRIVDKLATSPTFDGRPDREQVEAALERIAHQVLVQRDWDDERTPVAAAR